MKQIVRNTFSALNAREKRKLRLLAFADVLINILDIGFLIILLFVISFYTNTIPDTRFGSFSVQLFQQQPLLLIVVFLLVYALKNLLGFFIAKWQFHFAYDVASRLSRENLLMYLNGTFADFVQIDSSVINRKISQQPIEFAHYVLNGIQQAFSQTILIIISIIAILFYDPVLFLLLILVFAPPVVVITYFMKRRMITNRLHGKRTSELSIQYLQEALAGFVEANVYGKKDFFAARYNDHQSRLNKYLSQRQVIQSIPSRLMEVMAVFGLFALILINYFSGNNDSISILTIGAFMAAAYKIIPGIVKLMNLLGQIKTYAFSTEGLSYTKETGLNSKVENNSIESLAFNNVQFNYGDKQVLNNFSFSISKGDIAGITGLSGKGKTSIANLLLGFSDPAEGSIYFNNKPAGMEERQSHWNKIAYIKQQPFLIHASLVQNITMQESNHDEERLKKVVMLTGVDKLAAALPGELDFIITENGKNFSGGQRQRIIFARALYKNFDLLILDEPFNELDETAELEMLKQLQNFSKEGKMILLITHNKSLLSFCNKKISLDEQR